MSLNDVSPIKGDREESVEGKRPEEGPARKPALLASPASNARPSLAWPWGLVAIGVMALAWVGIYLLWNGLVFLFSL
ncbi:hypothetical protein [Devosia ginsengisoli]|uniref:hypothetical protein n=1 Tax=Devosia ginsengisoli TaxID=400770 RepID=UPI0026F09895|nr:hypothetical protein [Devosia ginsengisoli]MCR6671312.1 hypothetical protein [Devosia ginsengisoli]